MVVSYLLTNMKSPHDLCVVATKNFFFCKMGQFYFQFMNSSNHCGDVIMLYTGEQTQSNRNYLRIVVLIDAGEAILLDAGELILLDAGEVVIDCPLLFTAAADLYASVTKGKMALMGMTVMSGMLAPV